MAEHDSLEALLAEQRRSQDAYNAALKKVSRGKYAHGEAELDAGEEAVPFQVTVETAVSRQGDGGAGNGTGFRKSLLKSPSTPSKQFYHVVDETLGEVDEDLGPEERGCVDRNSLCIRVCRHSC